MLRATKNVFKNSEKYKFSLRKGAYITALKEIEKNYKKINT